MALAPRNDAIPSPFLGYGDHESLSSLQQMVSTDWVESTDVWPSPPIRCCRLDAYLRTSLFAAISDSLVFAGGR